MIESPSPEDPSAYPFRRPPTFGEILLAATPRTFTAFLLIGANVAVWILMVARGVDPQDPAPLDLFRWGANFGPAARDGEWWRLATSMFIHVGWMHLAMNMYGLYALGPFVERLFGNLPFVVLYLVGGLAGSLASIVAHDEPVVSAGASGALFAVLGGLAGYLARHGRTSIPRSVVRGLTGNVLTIIALNVALGFSIPQIDNAAHFGGLLSGFLLGVALAQPLSQDGVRRRGRRAAIVGAVGLAAIAAACVLLPR